MFQSVRRILASLVFAMPISCAFDLPLPRDCHIYNSTYLLQKANPRNTQAYSPSLNSREQSPTPIYFSALPICTHVDHISYLNSNAGSQCQKHTAQLHLSPRKHSPTRIVQPQFHTRPPNPSEKHLSAPPLHHPFSLFTPVLVSRVYSSQFNASSPTTSGFSNSTTHALSRAEPCCMPAIIAAIIHPHPRLQDLELGAPRPRSQPSSLWKIQKSETLSPWRA